MLLLVVLIMEYQDLIVICDDQEMFGIGVIQENDSVDSFGSDFELCVIEIEFVYSSSDNWGGWLWWRW